MWKYSLLMCLFLTILKFYLFFLPFFFHILSSNTEILNESLFNVDGNVKRVVIAWWLYLTHIYCCPFVCAKREERPRS